MLAYLVQKISTLGENVPVHYLSELEQGRGVNRLQDQVKGVNYSPKKVHIRYLTESRMCSEVGYNKLFKI